MKTIEELGISPWPWHVRDIVLEGPDVICGKWIVDADGNDLTTELYGDGIDGIKSNARLMAAAPELYEAIAALLHCAEREAPYTDMSQMTTAMDMARKALANAGGEEVKHG